jgi:hypothetical protein
MFTRVNIYLQAAIQNSCQCALAENANWQSQYFLRQIPRNLPKLVAYILRFGTIANSAIVLVAPTAAADWLSDSALRAIRSSLFINDASSVEAST